MPDRRRRTAFRQPLPERATLLMRERSSSSSSGSSDSSGGRRDDDNPFAPPPEGRPDQPWQPRHPSGGGTDGNGGGDGNGGDTPEGGSSDSRPAWGSQWSSRQPGRQNGPFGGRPAGPGGPNGRGGPEGAPAGPRWDPTDPIQRRARYALLTGMWAVFFAIFDFSEIALLLGALATYWAISALRAKPKPPVPGGAPAPGPGAGADGGTGSAGAGGSGGMDGAGAWGPAAPGTQAAQRGGRQQTTAAVSGLVTGLVALVIVATTFTVQLVYRDYYTCVNDALTKSGQLSCNDLLPKPLEPFFGVKR